MTGKILLKVVNSLPLECEKRKQVKHNIKQSYYLFFHLFAEF